MKKIKQIGLISLLAASLTGCIDNKLITEECRIISIKPGGSNYRYQYDCSNQTTLFTNTEYRLGDTLKISKK